MTSSDGHVGRLVDWLAKDRERQLSSMEFSEYNRSLKCVKCKLEN